MPIGVVRSHYMRSGKGLRYIKRVRSKGQWYAYFDTGQKDGQGKRIYASLGNMAAYDFGTRYAAMLGHRERRNQIRSEITVPHLLDLYQKSEKYRSKAPSTKRVYDLYIGEFAKKLPTAPAGEIERSDVTLFLDSMADRPAAANLALGAIGALYSWGRRPRQKRSLREYRANGHRRTSALASMAAGRRTCCRKRPRSVRRQHALLHSPAHYGCVRAALG